MHPTRFQKRPAIAGRSFIGAHPAPHRFRLQMEHMRMSRIFTSRNKWLQGIQGDNN
jgi:hypothetical protein